MDETAPETPAKNRPKVWVISDGRGLTGNLNACLGVADALEGDIETIDVTTIEAYGGIKPFLERKVGMTRSGCEGPPNYIVTFFSKTAQVAAEMKELLKSKTDEPVFLIQIRTPGKNFEKFDLIVNPSHEKPISGSNVMESIGVPHRVNKETLEQGYSHWQDQFSGLQDKKIIAVLLGGNTPSIPDYPDQGGPFTAEDARALGKKINQMALEENANLLVTSSPRTKPEAWQAFMDEITVPGYFHDINMDTQKLQRGNPYIGMLSAADEIVVTGDSTSMLCEAASTGKPLFVACDIASNMCEDHSRFVDAIVSKGYAKRLQNRVSHEVFTAPKPLNTAADIAAEAKRRYAIQLDYMHERTFEG